MPAERWNYCPECGQKLEAAWTFCPGCSHKIGELVTIKNEPVVYPYYPYWQPTPTLPGTITYGTCSGVVGLNGMTFTNGILTDMS